MNAANLEALTTAQIVSVYNGLAKTPVTKFRDRATALKRTAALIEQHAALPLEEEAVEVSASSPEFFVQGKEKGWDNCPNCGVHLSNGVMDYVNDETLTHEFRCLGCGEEFGAPIVTTTKEKSMKRSEGVKKSWEYEPVAQARSARHGVTVTSPEGVVTQFKSVAKAFEALGLPMSKHIKLRKVVKTTGAAELDGYKFAILELKAA